VLSWFTCPRDLHRIGFEIRRKDFPSNTWVGRVEGIMLQKNRSHSTSKIYGILLMVIGGVWNSNHKLGVDGHW
jgi:hypothetical protein